MKHRKARETDTKYNCITYSVIILHGKTGQFSEPASLRMQVAAEADCLGALMTPVLFSVHFLQAQGSVGSEQGFSSVPHVSAVTFNTG